MKPNNNTTAIIAADKKATAYFCLMTPLQAKKVLFELTRLTGDQRMIDSDSAEIRTIAKMYDGYILQSKAAKELAAKLAKAYADKHPGVLLTKKSVAQYTDARYRKLIEAVGEYGFDYVLEALRQGKAYVANPANNIDEKQMLRAMRWEERREGQDTEASNRYHRVKGLKLAGLEEMAEVLVEHAFVIANVYEMVEAIKMQCAATSLSVIDEMPLEEPASANYNQPLSVADMKIHFISQTGLLKDFYGRTLPVVPEGYSEEELAPGSIIVELARKGRLKDSEEVLKYVDLMDRYNSLAERMEREFCSDELEVICEKADTVMALLAITW